jgi:hypothetical protein
MPLITLLTDYGLVDEFVGVLHGVIAMICPDAKVIDLTHGVPRHDVRSGAGALAQALPYTPVGVHVAVVDPTVGGDRRGVALRTGDGRVLIGPDNGLLWPASEKAGGVVEAFEISESPWRLEPFSPTFHGRDVFTPVAAHLALDEPLAAAGVPLDPDSIVRLETPPAWIEAGTLVAQVTGVDRFGNLQLGASRMEADALGLELAAMVAVRIATGENYSARFVRTFGDVDPGELVLFEDSSQKLALGFNQGNAAGRLGLQIGDELRIEPRR